MTKEYHIATHWLAVMNSSPVVGLELREARDPNDYDNHILRDRIILGAS